MKFSKVMKKVLKEAIAEVRYISQKLFEIMEDIINILNPFIFWGVMRFEESNNVFLFLIPIVLFFASKFCKRVNRIVKGSEEIPAYKKRFTKRENGVVMFNMGDIYEMVSYLYEVENSLERKGYYK